MIRDHSPTTILCEYVVRTRYEDIPKEAIAMAKACILDSIGCTVGGSNLEPGRIIIDFYRAMGGVPEATVMATGEKLPLVNAVYVNAFLANVLDFDDTYGSVGHPGATVIPPALAVGEWRRANGMELLTSVVLGYETSLRVGLAIQATPERYKQVLGLGTYQIIGAGTAAGKLLKLDRLQMRNAIGLACANAPVPYCRKLGLEVEERPFAWSKNNYGWASMGGVLGALLTEKGFIGNRFVLDGERGFWAMAGSDRCDFGKMTAGLGEIYLILNNSFKPYSSCRWTHSTIDACLKILEKHAIPPSSIASITVKGMYEMAKSLAQNHPENIIDAQFSIPHVVSLCITGHPPSQGLVEAHLKDDIVRSVAGKVKIELDPEIDRLYFEKGIMGSTVIIRTENGGQFEESVYSPKGSPQSPMSTEEQEKKFFSLTVPVWGKGKAEKMLETVNDLEKVKDVGLLIAN